MRDETLPSSDQLNLFANLFFHRLFSSSHRAFTFVQADYGKLPPFCLDLLDQ
jgi:hypothetical protein